MYIFLFYFRNAQTLSNFVQLHLCNEIYEIYLGIYHSCTGGKQRTTDEYLRGGKDIGVIPAALSLTVSFVSSIMIIGWPAEVYTFGGQYFLGGFGFALGYLLCAFIYVPVLYPLKTTTANEVY